MQKNFFKGARIKIDDLAFKKPENGIQTKYYKKIINRIAKVNIKEDELIKWGKIKKIICFVILSRANYSSIKSVMQEVKKSKKFDF